MSLLSLTRLLVAAVVLSLVVPVVAQESGATGNGEKRAAKERARQERIAEYEQKREERRAARQAKKQVEAAVKIDETDELVMDDKPAKKKRTRRHDRDEVRLPRDLKRAQEFVRASVLARDPSVITYLDLVASGEASAQQLGAFGNFLGQNGFLQLALIYYGTALSVDDQDPLLWLNIGTLHRKTGDLDRAAGAYTRALRLDPNNAFAHYNLGAALDILGKYEDALEEYRIALTLQPSLGDPETNPQAANNERLTAVKVMLYQEQAGSIGLPLVELPRGQANR